MPVRAPSVVHEGRALRRARQRKHISLEAASEATRISERYLSALEAEAPVEAFPAPVYARAFLREYAQFLGMDPDRLIRSLEERHGEQGPDLRAMAGLAGKRPNRWPGRLLVVASLATFVALGVMKGGSQDRKPATPIIAGRPHVNVAPVGQERPNRPERVPARKPAGPRSIRVILHVVSPCWVRGTADGAIVLGPTTLLPGRSVTITAKRSMRLRLGNAGGVRLLLNGRRVRAGDSGEVVDLSFVLKHGKVRRL